MQSPKDYIVCTHLMKTVHNMFFHSDSILPGRSSCPFFMVGHTVSPSNLFKSSSEKFISNMSVISGLSEATPENTSLFKCIYFFNAKLFNTQSI